VGAAIDNRLRNIALERGHQGLQGRDGLQA
jgi:hypothetical protein